MKRDRDESALHEFLRLCEDVRKLAKEGRWPMCRAATCEIWNDLEHYSPFSKGRTTWIVNQCRLMFSGIDNQADLCLIELFESLARIEQKKLHSSTGRASDSKSADSGSTPDGAATVIS